MLLGLVGLAERHQQANQRRARFLVIRRDPHERASVLGGALRFAGEALQQRIQQTHLVRGRALALAHVPRRVIVERRDLEAFEWRAAVTRGGRFELLERRLVELAARNRRERCDVDGDVRRVEAHGEPIGDDALARLVVDEPAQLRQAPTQRAAGIVGNLPQQLAKMLAAERASRQREIGEQRAGLARRRELDALAAASDLEIAEKLQRQ